MTEILTSLCARLYGRRAAANRAARALACMEVSKHKTVPSVRFTTGAIRATGDAATLPVLDRIKTRKDAGDRLAGARILAATAA